MAYGALRTRMEGIMTGAEAVVLGLILAAFAIFTVTLAWGSFDDRRVSTRAAANDEARPLIAKRTATRQLRRS